MFKKANHYTLPTPGAPGARPFPSRGRSERGAEAYPSPNLPRHALVPGRYVESSERRENKAREGARPLGKAPALPGAGGRVG